MRAAVSFGHLFHQDRASAIGASRENRLVPGSKFTFWILVTSVKYFAPTRFAFLQIALFALRALDAEIRGFFQRLDVFAFRIAAAAEKSAELAPAQQHRPAALLAGFVDFFLGGNLDFAVFVSLEILGVLALGILWASEKFTVAAPLDHHLGAALVAIDIRRYFLSLDVAHLFFGFFQVARKRRVEALHRLGPFFFAIFDLVELVFHACGKLDVQDIGETLDQEVGDEKSQIGRRQRAAFVLGDVLPVENIGYDRRVGGRPADAFFIELFDQRRLRIARRRLGKVLPRIHRQQVERIAFL